MSCDHSDITVGTSAELSIYVAKLGIRSCSAGRGGEGRRVKGAILLDLVVDTPTVP